jgi:hypothetical protein
MHESKIIPIRIGASSNNPEKLLYLLKFARSEFLKKREYQIHRRPPKRELPRSLVLWGDVNEARERSRISSDELLYPRAIHLLEDIYSTTFTLHGFVAGENQQLRITLLLTPSTFTQKAVISPETNIPSIIPGETTDERVGWWLIEAIATIQDPDIGLRTNHFFKAD